MSVNIGTIDGLIQLKDEFTGTIGLAKASLSNFTKQNQESLKAIAGFAGLAGAAFAAVATTVVALGQRGSEVNDLRATVVQFTGSAQAADAVLQALRAGTNNTVDSFTLLGKAAHLTSTGVKLTAAEFQTLGAAAAVMSDRGLGSTAEALDLVSDAMVSGRTKALALKLGVIDVGDAENIYAATLGTTAEYLSEAAKAEAHRIETLRILTAVVKESGSTERDFADQITAARVAVVDWVDKVAGAIAQSDVFAKGMKAIETAVQGAFGADQAGSINTAVTAIEKGAIAAVGFGIGMVQAATVVHAAWGGINAVVLSITTGVVWLAEKLASLFSAAAAGAAALHLIPKGAAAEMEEARIILEAMTADLAKQVDESVRAVKGTSEFNQRLDAMGGALYQVRDAMEAARTSTQVANETNEAGAAIIANNTAQLAKLGERLLDNQKIQDAINEQIKKETPEIAKLYADAAAQRIALTGTTMDAEKAAIEATFQAAVAGLEKMVGATGKANPLYAEHFAALRATADQALGAVGNLWTSVSDTSIRSLRQTAEAERALYNQMAMSGTHFREDLDKQREKTEAAEAAARGMGSAYTSAFNSAAAAAEELAAKTKAAADEAAKLKAINMSMGGSFEVNRGNWEATARGMGTQAGGDIERLLRLGYSFQQAILWAKHPDWAPPENIGPRVPGFASGVTNFAGGLARVHGGELLVNLPQGTDVVPAGRGGGGASINVTMHMSGILVGNSAAARTEFVDFAGKAITDQLLARGWHPPLAVRR